MPTHIHLTHKANKPVSATREGRGKDQEQWPHGEELFTYTNQVHSQMVGKKTESVH